MTIIYDMVSNEFVDPLDDSIEVEARQSGAVYSQAVQLQLQEIEPSRPTGSHLPADLAYQTFIKSLT